MDLTSWKTAGIEKIEDQMLQGNIMLFPVLSDKYGLSQKEIFRYLRIKSFMLGRTIVEVSEWDKLLIASTSKCPISRVQKFLVRGDDTDKPRAILLWELDMKASFTTQYWFRAWREVRKAVHCINSQEHFFKLMHRWYLVPEQLAKFSVESEEICWRYQTSMECMKTEIKLVVTGDDFGYCPRRDLGIVECFCAGGLSNVSLVMNGSSVASAAGLAQRYNIPIGLHANLSEGIPVCAELRHNSSLINTEGVFLGKMGIRKAVAEGLVSMSEVRQELQAQVNLFRELTGQNPQHMDGHQHVHVLPTIREEFAQVLQENAIQYTRLPVELGLYRCDWIQEELMAFNRGVQEDALNSMGLFKIHGIRWPDLYIGLSTMGKNMSTDHIQRAVECGIQSLQSGLSPGQSLQRLPPQSSTSVSIEMMTHPGYPSMPHEGGCGEGPDEFSQSVDRLHELEVLRNSSLRNYYNTNSVQLCSFKDL
ncbi:carbohydrate deacetylase [Pelodytes ibericus]